MFNRNRYIFHIAYPENIYKHLGLFKNKNEVVITIHQTPQYFDLHPQHRYWIGRASKLIVMSASLEEYFKKHFPTLPVKFIPHPVDTDFFKMNGHKEDQVILVGNWLRDHQFAQRVFSQLSSNINILVVTAKANWHHYNSETVSLKSGIPDEELLQLYQRSKVVFLPLTSYTANNALAEAISCGCKVVVASDHLDLAVFKIKNNPVTVGLNTQQAIDLIESEIRNWSETDAKRDRELAKGYYSNEVIGRETALYLIS
jgi:glycosyltransferase involved in cell wall biosynthesis